jgi:CheY-like chemotaxis protein
VKYRILVVEDNELNRELLGDWLETEGYEVLSAADLQAAAATIETHPPHAILLDIKLGEEDGLTLAAWVRRQPKLCHIPVLAVTAHALASDEKRILQAGCNAWIAKPVDFNTLREHLHRWLLPLAQD